MDGAVGYPAYSGALSNPMVTSALTTTREALVAGDAAWSVHDPRLPLLTRPFLSRKAIDAQSVPKYDWAPRFQVAALQAGVRSAMVEVELLRGVRFDWVKGVAQLRIRPGGKVLVAIGKLDQTTVFDAQLALVESFAALRAERMPEILTQVVPQTVHWSAVAGLSPERHRYTWELIGVGLRFAALIGMQFKYAFNVPRASERSAAIQPMLLTPGHASYPSGHATEACFVAELLPLLAGDPSHPGSGKKAPLPGRSDGTARQLNRLALRIAENRVVAGLHFPVDTIAGQALGVMLARYVAWMSVDKMAPLTEAQLTVGAHAFPKPGEVVGKDALPPADAFVDDGQQYISKPLLDLSKKTAPAAPVLRDLWTLARREWVGP